MFPESLIAMRRSWRDWFAETWKNYLKNFYASFDKLDRFKGADYRKRNISRKNTTIFARISGTFLQNFAFIRETDNSEIFAFFASVRKAKYYSKRFTFSEGKS